ncbi:hypothetical protein BpHYR1_043984, partial [Brachionus plicatilis]
ILINRLDPVYLKLANVFASIELIFPPRKKYEQYLNRALLKSIEFNFISSVNSNATTRTWFILEDKRTNRGAKRIPGQERKAKHCE